MIELLEIALCVIASLTIPFVAVGMIGIAIERLM